MNEAEEWIQLSNGKEFSRLLYPNPVCFLYAEQAESQQLSPDLNEGESSWSNAGVDRCVQVVSWLTATDNEGSFVMSLNNRRCTASILLQQQGDAAGRFSLSVPVQGMEDLVLQVGSTSGRHGRSKFPEDHQKKLREKVAAVKETTEKCNEEHRVADDPPDPPPKPSSSSSWTFPPEYHWEDPFAPAGYSETTLVASSSPGKSIKSSKHNRNSKKRPRFPNGIPGLQTVPLGCNASVSDQQATNDASVISAIRGTVAHLSCRVLQLISHPANNATQQQQHTLVMARVEAAHVHSDYWDEAKKLFRPQDASVPPFLTFFGSQTFGYVVAETSGSFTRATVSSDSAVEGSKREKKEEEEQRRYSSRTLRVVTTEDLKSANSNAAMGGEDIKDEEEKRQKLRLSSSSIVFPSADVAFPTGTPNTSRSSNEDRDISNGSNENEVHEALNRRITLLIDQCEATWSPFRKKLMLCNMGIATADVPHISDQLRGLGKSLHTLSLSGNSQLYTLPQEKSLVRSLPTLQKLDLSNCRLQSLPFEWNLPQLKWLDLSNNFLREFPHTRMLEGLPELRELSIFGNHVTEIVLTLGVATCLSRLQTLDLGYNDLAYLPEELDMLESLRELKVRNNFLTRIPMRVVDSPSLRHLDVSSNPISVPPLETCERGICSMRRYYQQVKLEEEAKDRALRRSEEASKRSAHPRANSRRGKSQRQ